MKIIITGITGLIGNHVMQVLLQNNYNDIRGTYFSNRNLEEYKQQGIEMRYADISNENSIKNITKDCAIVVHSAARVMDFGTKQQFYAAHYDATHYLLKDAKKNGVQHFIYVSSVGAASSIDRNKIIPDETVPVKKTGIHYDDVKIDIDKIEVEQFIYTSRPDSSGKHTDTVLPVKELQIIKKDCAGDSLISVVLK